MEKNNGARVSLNSIGSLLSDSWKLYQERFAVLTEIMLLPVLLLALAEVLFFVGSFFTLLGGIIYVAALATLIFVSVAIISSIHNNSGVDASYKNTVGLFWPFVWMCILNALAVFGGMFMLIVPGIFLAVALGMAKYTFVIEGRRGIDALRQSKDYIKGYWWAVLGRSLLLSLGIMIFIIVVEFPLLTIFGKMGGAVAGLILMLFFVPFAAVYVYKIFENLRALKPELADTQTKIGDGFLKASAIVGLVAPIIIAILAIFLLRFGVFHAIRSGEYRAPISGYGMQTFPLQQ